MLAALLLLSSGDDLPRAYHQALAKIGAAKTLRVVVEKTDMDGTKSTTRFLFKKPNLWRISDDNNLSEVCDGKFLWVREDKEWSRAPAPASIPTNLLPFGLDRFADPSAPAYSDRIGPTPWKINGKERRSWWLKTTEAGSYAGYIVVDAKTYMPIGHHYSEMGAPGPRIEVYSTLELNPKLTAADFRLD